MNDLEKILVAKGSQSLESGEAAVKEVKQLLASNAAEEITTLRSVGLDADIKFLESQQEEYLIRKTSGEKFARPIVSLKEIKKMCLDYRLYMKPAKEYVGRIPADLGAELTRFCKEKAIPLPAHSDYSRFLIIAPPKMFKGYKTAWQVFADAVRDTHTEMERRRIAAAEDPILVYKIDETHFAVIKSWGEDLTILRRFHGIITRRAFIKPFLAMVTLAGIVAMIWGNVEYWQYAFEVSNSAPDRSWTQARPVIGGFVVSIATVVFWAIMSSIENTGPGRMIRQNINLAVTNQNEGGLRK